MKKILLTIFSLAILVSAGSYYYTAKATVYGSSLVGWYTLDRNSISGTAVTDYSGNVNTGTLVNSPSIGTGKLAQGIVFNGTNQYISNGIPASLNLSGANQYTLAAWVYPTDNPYGNGIIAEMYLPSNTTVQYELGFDSDEGPGTNSRPFTGFFDSAGTGWYTVRGTNNVALNKWALIVGTWDGTTLSIYQDGRLLNTSTPGGSLPSANFDDVVVGRRHDDAGSKPFFPGTIDDVRIYNRALTAADVQQLYYYGLQSHVGAF